MRLPEDVRYDPEIYQRIKPDMMAAYSAFGVEKASKYLLDTFGERVREYMRRAAIDMEVMQRPKTVEKVVKSMDSEDGLYMLRWQLKDWEALEDKQSKEGEDRELIAKAFSLMYGAAGTFLDRLTYGMSYAKNPLDWFDKAPVEMLLAIVRDAKGSRFEANLGRLTTFAKDVTGPIYLVDFYDRLWSMPRGDDPFDRDMYRLRESENAVNRGKTAAEAERGKSASEERNERT